MPITENNRLPEIYSADEQEKSSGERARERGKIWRFLRVFIFSLVVVSLGAMLVINAVMRPSTDEQTPTKSEKSGKFSWFTDLSIFSPFRRIAESSGRLLKGEDRDRINILLLGMGGGQHAGAYLTDTIILASLKPSTKDVALFSIPRDLTVPIEDMGWRKINNINALAEMENKGSGGLATSQALSQLFNLPIDYYVRLDFEGFSKIIDELGGVRVFVDNTLDDYRYPILGLEDSPNYNARWEHLHIEAGWQQMDGALALKYARSRHGLGSEGSDFARARRQQKILSAVKDKLFSLNVLFKPTLITGIISAYQEHVSTNLKVWEMVRLWDLFKDVSPDRISNKVFDNSPDGLLVDGTGDEGAYILTPRAGDFSQLQYAIANAFADAPAEIKQKVSGESAKIVVRNGTWVNGLATRAATDLEKFGFDVLSIGNASQRNFQVSVIYDLTNGAKPGSLGELKNKTGANVSFGLPDWLKNDLAKDAASGGKSPVQPDFVLIIGQAADTTKSGTDNPVQ